MAPIFPRRGLPALFRLLRRVCRHDRVVIGSGKFWQVIGHAVAAAKGPASRLAAIVAIVPAKVKKKQAAALEEVLEGLYGLGWDVTETIPAGLREWYRGRASRSLIKALGAGPAGHEAHHIVDVMRPSADATASRKILSEYGVEVNGALNGAVSYTHLTLPTNREV